MMRIVFSLSIVTAFMLYFSSILPGLLCFHIVCQGDGQQQLDPAVVRAIHITSYSDNAFSHFFEAVDTNHDAKFSKSEYYSFRFPEYSEALCHSYAVTFLAQHDRDNSASLSLDEFLNGTLVIQSPGDSPYSAQAFDFRSERNTVSNMFEQHMDKDQDGELSILELAAVLHPTHFSHAVNEAYLLFVKCDFNGDHEISEKELVACPQTTEFLQRTRQHGMSRTCMAGCMPACDG
eukprot:m.108536 g.108536  ORF g.108536 m.108536 type:complete len:234 (-) comp15213_c1_seq4:177-878(-)